MRLKETKMNNDTNIRVRLRSPLKSNPRNDERVYLSDIKEGMRLMKELLDKHKRLKRGSYD